jgi:Do/DeqQ family serine protease
MREFGKTVVAAVLGGAITFGASQAFNENDSKIIIEKTPASFKNVAAYTTNPDGSVQVDFSFAAAKVTPAVVHIKSTMKAGASSGRAQSIPPQLREFFGDQFGGLEQMPQQPSMGSGSGVIISDNGYIVTNNHVVEGASELEVTLSDKRTYIAKVIGTDPSTDIALLKIEAKDLPKLALANSDNIKVGQWVLAVGNPFNLSGTVTAGIVSAKGRNQIIRSEGSIESFIQTDAAVNPGNSGGALVDLNGDLVGINTAIFSETGSFAGYSFAVPTSIVSRVVEDLIEFGEVKRGYLGVQIRDMNSELAKETGLNVTQGVYIEGVTEEGAAKAAGLKKGDVILKVDDKAVSSVSQLQEAVTRHKPGEKVNIVIVRDGKEKDMKVALKGAAGTPQLVRASSSETLRGLGADLSAISATEAKQLGITGGVKVEELYPGALSAQTEIKEGFVITKVNKKAVKTVEEVKAAIEDTDGGVMLEGMYPGNPTVYYYAFGK